MAGRSRALTQRLPIYEGKDQARLRTWVQLVRTFYLVQRRIVSELTEHEMTLPQFDVMATLRFSEGVSQQELAERLLVTKGNVCVIVNRVEACGWVERRADPEDGRTNRLHLTSAGKRKIDAVLPDHDAVVLQALRTLASFEVQTLRELLEEVARANDEGGEGDR